VKSRKPQFALPLLSLQVALLGALLVLGWQAATVHCNYGGNWSALFYLGDRVPQPPELASDGLWIFQESAGYDGVFYHMVAHDPWLRRGFARFADNASLRWRRILIPGLAHLAAGGVDSWIHLCYIAVNLLFVFAGVWWLSRYCVSQGERPCWGLAFLFVPSVLVSMDRLTIDTALAALAVGFVYYASAGRKAISLAVLTLCPLARETGICLSAGHALFNAQRRRWPELIWTAATVFPFFLWTAFVFLNTFRDATPWISWPFAGIVHRTLHPVQYAITGPWLAAAAALDCLALLGIWIALLLAARLLLKRSSGLIEMCLYAFATLALFLGKEDIWAGAYEFGRTLSPILILLALLAVRDKMWLHVAPLLCVLPRILLQLEPQVRGLIRQLAA
jgi:hypothetical protein